MYKSFSVYHFRNFSSLTLNNLKRFNIITGMNNCGKTALLEAIFLHIGPMNPMLTTTIKTFRGIHGMKVNTEALWGDLFHNYDINEPIKMDATYMDNTKGILTITLIPSSVISFPEKREEASNQLSSDTQLPLMVDRDLKYEFQHGRTKSSTTMRMTREGFKLEPNRTTKIVFPGFFIPARHHLEPSPVAERFGNLQVQRKEGPIVEALKIIEPKLKSLTVIPIGPEPTIHVDIGADRLLPIQLAGEGMVRLAEIAIDIASSPKGVVLIDDAGTGIHHSILPSFWTVVFELARKIDTQLFITTHSKESIKTAHDVMMKMSQYDMQLVRLQWKNSHIEAITYDKETIDSAIETGLEVR